MHRIIFVALSIALAFTNVFPLGTIPQFPIVSAPLPQEETLTPSPTEPAATETPTPASTPTPEIFPTATEEATESVTPTLEVTEIPSPTPEATVVVDGAPADLPETLMELKASPRFLRPGGKVNLHWYLDIDTLASAGPLADGGGYRLRLQLPANVIPEEGEPFVVNADGVLESSVALEKPNGKVKLAVLDQAVTGETAVIRVQLLKDGVMLAEQELSLVVAQRVTKAKGGEVSGAKDRRAKVIFPPNALPEDADVVVMDLGWEDDDLTSSSSGKPWHPFKIEAYRANGEEITHFDQEITIEYAYDPEEYAGNESVLYLSYFDEETQEWVALPGEVDMDGKRIIARSDHLTVLNPNYVEWQAAMLPGMAGWQVSTYTGAATYSIPLNLPEGPGGFKPSLELSYNSQVIDNAGIYSQASWVGMGWSLDVPYIQREFGGTNSVGDDLFSIHLNGVSGILLRDTEGYWHTEDESFARIKLHDGSPNDTTSWWEVWLKDGTRYIFGSEVDGSRAYADIPYCWDGSEVGNIPWQWGMSKIISRYGQEIHILYDRYQPLIHSFNCGEQTELTVDGTFWMYPKEIRYPQDAYIVKFNFEEKRSDYQAGWDNHNTSTLAAYMKNRLGSIETRYDPDQNPNTDNSELIRKYSFIYANDALAGIDNTIIWPGYSWGTTPKTGSPYSNKTLTLIRFQEQVCGDDQVCRDLPPYTFNYGTGVTTDGITYPNGDGQHLRWVENGYGGRIEFTYSPWSCNDESTCTLLWNSSSQNDNWKVSLDDLGPTRKQFYSGNQRNLIHPGARYELHLKVERTYGDAGIDIQILGRLDNGTGYQRTVLNETFKNRQQTLTLDKRYLVDGNALPQYVGVDTQCAIGYEVGCHIYEVQYRYLPTFYRVTAMKTIDQPSGESYTTNYGYSGGKMNETIIDQKSWMRIPPYTEFRGFNEVTESAPDGHKTIYDYWQGEERDAQGNWIGKHLQGRLKEIRVTGANTAEIYNKTVYTYLCDYGFGVLFQKPSGFWVPSGVEPNWSHLISEDVYIYNGNINSFVGKRTVYDYADTLQGGLQLGNITHQTEFEWINSAWQPVRGTKTEFYPNVTTTRYLTGLPGMTQTFDCSGTSCNFAGTPISEVRYIYDSNTNHTTPPTTGNLTRLRTKAGTITDPDKYIDQTFAYDGWGNQVSATAYVQHGSEAAFAAGDSQTTTACYGGGGVANCVDDGLHTYLLWTENSIGRVSSTYNYRTGNLLSETNLNGRVTEAEYDSLGRLTKIYLPKGNTEFLALSVEYHLPTGPSDYFWTKATQKVSDTTSRSIYKLYNGLGQLVQTQMPTSEAEGLCSAPGSCTLVTDYYEGYESNSGVLYQVNKNSLPRAVLNLTGGSYSMPDSSTLWNSTYSDALGRPVTQIAAGGLVTRNTYGIEALIIAGVTANYQLTTTIEEAEEPENNVITKNYSDASGRLIAVVPAEGNRIVYTYDAMDRLTHVDQVRSDTLATFATTILSYDLAGRKIQMNDPAMGVWEYTYDATGNLVFQKNVDNKNTCLYYDSANRLKGKIYIGENASCERNAQVFTVKYTYDAGTDGKGQRTGMVDSTGETTWTYNELGLVKTEQRVINQLPAGSNTFTQTFDYDDSGAMTALTYPDGEEVTTAYYPNGQPKGLASTLGDTFVANVQYDALGRKTSVSYGNGLKSAYTYFTWGSTDTENNGKLSEVKLTNSQDDSLFKQSFTGYDQAGNILEMALETENSGAQTITFSYDLLYRLRTASASGGSIPGYDLSYTFDPTGRIQSVTKGGVTSNYLYDDSAGHSTAVTSLGSNMYAYDPLGNMETRTENGITYTQEWTSENKLKKVTWTVDGQKYVTTNVYDGDGNRVLQFEETRLLTDQLLSEITTVYIGNIYEKQFNTTGIGMGGLFAAAVADRQYQVADNPPRSETLYAVSFHPINQGEMTDEIDPPTTPFTPGMPKVNVAHPVEPLNILQAGAGQVIGPFTYPATLNVWCEMYATGDASDPNMHLKMVLTLSNGQSLTCAAGRSGTSDPYHGYNYITLPANVTATISYQRIWFGGNIWGWTPYNGTSLGVTREAGVRLYARPDGMHRESAWVETESNAYYNSLYPNLQKNRWWYAEMVNPNGYGVTFFTILMQENDVTAPVNPTSATPNCTASNNAWQNTCADPNFTWSGASDGGSGVDGYYLYWGTSSTGTSTTYTTNLGYNPAAVSSGTYYMRVQTRDKVGNLAAWKTIYTFKYDNTPPSVPTSATDSLGVVSGVAQSTKYDPNFTWTLSSDSHSGLAGYNVYWGTSSTGNTVTAFTTTAGFNPPPLTGSGTYYLRIQTKDNINNLSAWTTVFTYIYTGTPAALSLVELLPMDGSSNLYITGSKAYYGPGSTGNLQVSMKTGQAGTSFSVGLLSLAFPTVFTAGDGATLNLQGTLDPDVYSQTYAVVSSSDASGSFSATLTDVQQNTSQASFSVEKDAAAPVAGDLAFSVSGIAVYYVPLTRTLYYSGQSSDSVSISLAATDGQSGVREVEFPGLFGSASLIDTTSPYQRSYTAAGSSTTQGSFTLTARDRVGNAVNSAAFTLVKDTSAPAGVGIDTPAATTLRFPVRWQAADGQAGIRGYDVEYRVEPAGSWMPLLSVTPRTQSEFVGEEGVSYRFRVRAIDNVGNTSAWVESQPSTVQTTVTKYYYLAGQRVAMRQGSALTYLYGDHLGSTSLIANAAGAVMAETRYQPYGQVYWQWGATQTDFTFTGQRMDGFGLMDYNARYYSSTLGRFVSPDTIIPQNQGVQAWDRYAFVNNNPVKFTDPTGHCIGPLLLVCIGVALIGAAISIAAINTGVEQVAWASSQTETIAQEQAVTQQWQDNCMGQCHYADSVGPTPGVTVGGPRPETPVSDTLGMGYYNIIQGTVGLVGSTIAAGELAVNSLSVKTPYGRAWQKLTPDAFRLRSQVSNGAEIYRGGVLGQTNVAEGQFWAPENPLLPGYADRYGVGSYGGLPDFVVGGSMKPGGHFITRNAPSVGSNLGGALEVVTRPNTVHLNYLSMQ
jgi:RHS repeat-associated protein